MMPVKKKEAAEERSRVAGERIGRAARLFAFVRDGVYGLSARNIKSRGGERRIRSVLTTNTL